MRLQDYEFNEYNKRLSDIYGELEKGMPFFRLVWSDDVFEKRWMTHTDEGFQLLYPEVREVPKYRNWKPERYVLEGLQFISPEMESDIPFPISYEPIWTFEDKGGNYLPPIWPAIHFILETLKENTEKSNMVKYKDPDADPQEAIENKKVRVDKLVEDLFGNETNVTTALSHRSGVAYGPGSSPNTNSQNKEN